MTSTTDLLRLTVVTPSGIADLAIPADLPLADLVSTLARHGSANSGAPPLEGPLVLQRLGEEPLDLDRTAGALGLHDGETLHLRPRESELPSLEFDDLVDGVATGLTGRAGRWSPKATRRLLLGLALVPLVGGLLLVATAGPGPGAAVAGAGTAVLLSLAAVAASRAFGDESAGLLVALSALAFGAVAGVMALPVPAGSVDPGLGGIPDRLDAAALLAAGTAVAALALALVAGLPSMAPALSGIVVAAAAAVLAGVLAGFVGLTSVRTAATLLVVALLASVFAPGRAAAMARLRVPPPPTGTEDLQRDVAPLPGEPLLERARLADRYLTAVQLALGAVAGAALTVVVTGSVPARALALAAVLSLLLRSRVPINGWQRLAGVVPGTAGALLLVVGASISAGPAERFAVLALLVLTAGALAVCARTLPGRRLVPMWARAAEILELLSALVVLPLLLWVFGAYAAARAFGG